MMKKIMIKKTVNKKTSWCDECHTEIEPGERCCERKESGKKRVKICEMCYEKKLPHFTKGIERYII